MHRTKYRTATLNDCLENIFHFQCVFQIGEVDWSPRQKDGHWAAIKQNMPPA